MYWGDIALFSDPYAMGKRRSRELATEEAVVLITPDRIHGGDLLAARNRLVNGMLSNEVEKSSLLTLRVADLTIEHILETYHLVVKRTRSDGTSREDELMPMSGSEACDFFALVRANGDPDGFLFSCCEEGVPYGSRALTQSELDAIPT